uniref:DNA excision repair ERCC8like protein putative n=1 Tax=Albugo laibachii Nc14 TaxID=890382 RepID=F0WC87_9STRA|nr:DNA excision repair ERCC8like protein putative [Albugo laibachii Nc14]|eukprot:CCA18800.1 DNA excision repair ERCC8like protein putative [Albugo laibachii Nc14]
MAISPWQTASAFTYVNERALGFPSPYPSHLLTHQTSHMTAASHSFLYASKTSIWCMEIDPIYDQFLLVGTSKSQLLLYNVTEMASNLLQTSHKSSPSTQTPSALQESASTRINLKSTLPTGVSSLSWYPDGGIFIVSVFDEDGSVQIWDGNAFKLVKTWKLSSKVFTVQFSNCATTHSLAAASTGNGHIRLCDIATGACTHTLLGHKDAVYTLAWSPLNEYELVTACSRGEIRVWDIRRSGMTACLYCMSQDGEAVIPSRATVWEAQTSSSHTQHKTRMNVSSLSRQSRDIRRGNSVINEQHMNRKKQRRDPHVSASYSHVRAHNGGINSVCFTPNGRFVLSSASDQTIRLWSARNGSHAFVHYQDAKNGGMGRGIRMQCIQESDERSTILYHPNGNKGELTSYWVHPHEDTQLYTQAKCEGKLGVPLSCGSAPINKKHGHFGAITSCVYRKSHCELYTAGEDGMIKRWTHKEIDCGSEADSEDGDDEWSDLEEEKEEEMRFIPPILN